MSELRVVVADDEPLVRQAIRRFLSTRRDVELVAEARDGDEVVEAVRRHAPDLLLLDIQMPGRTGFEALAAVPPEDRPAVVFVTAHPEHALEAFDHEAVDYLLKPFDDARLGRALDRARERRGSSSAGDDALQRVLEALARGADPGTADRIPVRKGSRIRYVEVETLEAVQASGNYVVLCTASEEHMLRETLSELEECLRSHGFRRVHRSTLVRLRNVSELRPLPSGDADVVLNSGRVLRVSRSYRDAFEAAMKGQG